ncbi:MAG: YfhO family protein [Adlercreutzia sp.]|nr:YfhO family protein [Adlercreutzia sp.]
MVRTRGDVRYYGALLALCALAFASITLVHWVSGRSLLWDPDGIALYYNFFVYEGEWLRGIASSLIEGHPEVPLYSFDMGYGADVLATMGGCLNDPFNLVSAFCPPEAAEYVFEALILVRFVLAALAFSWYSFSRGRGRWTTLLGALCYVLCGYVAYWGVLRHPNFINFAILLPLILWGADRIMMRKSPYLFIGGFAFLLLFSLYFSYMMLLITVVYCLLAFFLGGMERSAKRFFGLVGQFALYVLLAALLAGFVAVPMFLVLTSMGRVDLVRTIPLWEPFVWYWRLGSNLIGGYVESRSLVMGAVPMAAMVAFFSARKLLDRCVWRPWAIGLVLCLVGSMVPAVGSAFNGFSYVTDRWLIAFGFCVANAATLVLPLLQRFRRRQWITFGVLCAGLTIWAGALAFDEPLVMSVCAVVLFVVAAIFVAVIHHASIRATGVCLSVLVVATSGITAVFINSSVGTSYVEQFFEGGSAQEVSRTVPYDRMPGDVGDSYRVDRAGIYGVRNQALLAGVKGIDFYSSFYNQNVDDARYALGVSTHWSNFMVNSVEGRFALENLMGARYFIVDDATHDSEGLEIMESRRDRAPYGYKKVGDLGESVEAGPFELYESELALPLAFTYDTACSESEFEKLGMVQRQELLTRACVLPDEALAVAGDAPADLATLEQDYEIIGQNGVRFTDRGLEVLNPRGELVLKAKGVAASENYVVFDHLVYTPLSWEERREITGEPVVIDAETGRTATEWDERKWTAPSLAGITVQAGDRSVDFSVATSDSSTYGGKTNWAVNMGYSEKAVKKFRIVFRAPGVYSWDKLSVASQPVRAIEDNLRELKAENKASIDLAVNRIGIDVAAEKGADERYVFMSIPYSTGWSATLDGQPVDILRANTGFMAVAMDGEAHKLVLTYCTPGLKAGLLCTGIGVLGIVSLAIGRRLRRARGNRSSIARG